MVRTLEKKLHSAFTSFAALLLFLGTLSGALTACSSDTNNKNAKVSMVIPKFPGSAFKTDLVAMAVDSSGWGHTVTQFSDVNCFGVHVLVPGMIGSPRVTCRNDNAAIVDTHDLFFGGYISGDLATLEIPSGTGRRFALIGMKASTPEACRAMKSGIDKSLFSKPVILARQTADLNAGENYLTMSVNFDGRQEFTACTGNGSGGMDPGTTLAIANNCSPEAPVNSAYSCEVRILNPPAADSTWELATNNTCPGITKSVSGIQATITGTTSATASNCVLALDVTSGGRTARFEKVLSVFQTTTVVPEYALHGANWNDYVVTGPAPSSACQTTTGQTAFGCIHGGERRKVPVPGVNDCANVTATDALGMFEWACEAGSPVYVLSSLKPNRGLKHLINEQADGFRLNSVRVFKNSALMAKSAPASWWSNPVAVLPDNSGDTDAPLDLTEGSKIYVVKTSRLTRGVNLNANKIGLVVMPGAVLSYRDHQTTGTNNCASGTGEIGTDSKCTVAAGTNHFLWIEGIFSGSGATDGSIGPSSYGILLKDVKHSRISNTAVQRHTQNGILLNGSEANRLEFVSSSNNNLSGISLNAASHYNILYGIQVANNGVYGIEVNSSNTNSILQAVLTSNGVSSNYGLFIAAGNGNIARAITVLKSGGTGIKVHDANSTALTHVVSAQNQNGLMLSATSALSGIRAHNLVLTNNSAYGLVSSTTSTISAPAFSGSLLVGNNSTNNCASSNITFTNGTCSAVGTDGSLVAGTLILKTARDLSLSFAGPLSTPDAVNADDDATPAPSSASIQNWIAFESYFRTWTKQNGVAGRCSGDLCRIYDTRLLATDTVIRNSTGNGDAGTGTMPTDGSACPTWLNGTVTGSFFGNVGLLNAIETVTDADGDNDGVCESNETCFALTNYGAYQGDRPQASAPVSCAFTNGTVTNVKMLGNPINGI